MKSSILFLVFSFCSLALIGQRIEKPSGVFRDIEPKDFLAKNLPSKYYNELYTYQINLDNGIQIIYTFSINDFGSLKDRVTGGKLSVRWLDGKDYVVNKEYPIDKFINEADSNKIILHPERNYWAKGNFDDEHTLNFKTTKDGVAYDMKIVLFDIARGKIWGDGIYKYKDTQFGMSLLIPDAKVKGYISINGEKVEAKGKAVMDLMFQNNLATDFMKKSYRLKTGDTENGLFLHFLTVENKGYKFPIGYGVKYSNGIAQMLTPSKIETNITKKTHGVYLDTNFRIKPFQTDTLHVKIKEHYDSYSILDELGGLKKLFARRYVGGEVVEMNGIATINDESAFFNFLAIDN